MACEGERSVLVYAVSPDSKVLDWPVSAQGTQPTAARVAARGPGGGGGSVFLNDPCVVVNAYVCSDFDLDVV